MKPPLQRIQGFAPHIGAVMSERGQGPEQGASAPPYAFFNLGLHVGDEAEAVHANRTAFASAIGATPIWLNQVHGTHCVDLDVEPANAQSDPMEADACLTTRPGLACTMMVADCLPILLCLEALDSQATGRGPTVVGAAHAGWRGLAAGVIETLLAQMLAKMQDQLNGPGNEPGRGLVNVDGKVHGSEQPVASPVLTAWLGPCIGPAAFEVGKEVPAAFGPDEQGFFSPHQPAKFLGDLPGLARHRLMAWTRQHRLVLRMVCDDLSRDPDCTVSRPLQYFSHRRDRQTGRMAAAIWIKAGPVK